MSSATSSWRDAVGEYDPEGHAAMVAYLGHVTGKDVLPGPTREMLLFAVSAALRFPESARTHGQRALDLGATKDELVHAVQLAGLSAGFTSVIVGMDVLGELD